MSQETLSWLNSMTLIGYTDQRGTAWHYRRAERGEESNHYAGAVPVEDVRRRPFNWQVLVGDVTNRATILGPDGVESVAMLDPTRKTMIRPPRALGPEDAGAVLGVFKAGYEPHDYERWLLDTVAQILDDDLNIGSAGLLRGGAQAWVSVEIPESISTPEGVEFPSQRSRVRPPSPACCESPGDPGAFVVSGARTGLRSVCRAARVLKTGLAATVWVAMDASGRD